MCIRDSYGPTEKSPVITVTRKELSAHQFGTVGPPLNGIEVKLADDGEILVTGPCVMQGYYKRPDLTAETIKEGWLHTGDIGVWDGANLKITDRKKELFKTSGGKYVAPQPLENKLKESPFIEQIMIVGAEQKFVGALIVPNFEVLREWMKDHHIIGLTDEEIIKHPAIIMHLESILETYNASFNQVERVKKFALLAEEWGIESGELTPKLSLKRKVIAESYKEVIEGLYNN